MRASVFRFLRLKRQLLSFQLSGSLSKAPPAPKQNEISVCQIDALSLRFGNRATKSFIASTSDKLRRFEVRLGFLIASLISIAAVTGFQSDGQAAYVVSQISTARCFEVGPYNKANAEAVKNDAENNGNSATISKYRNRWYVKICQNDG